MHFSCWIEIWKSHFHLRIKMSSQSGPIWRYLKTMKVTYPSFSHKKNQICYDLSCNSQGSKVWPILHQANTARWSTPSVLARHHHPSWQDKVHRQEMLQHLLLKHSVSSTSFCIIITLVNKLRLGTTCTVLGAPSIVKNCTVYLNISHCATVDSSLHMW